MGRFTLLTDRSGRVRVITADGRIDAFAGTGEQGRTGDGGLAREAELQLPEDVAVDSVGNVFIAERGRVREVSPDGTISTVAGGGAGGDGDPATEAELRVPRAVEVDSKGNIYVMHRIPRFRPQWWIQKVDAEGIIRTLPTRLPSGRTVSQPASMALDSQDLLVVSTAGRVWRISPEGEFEHVKGAMGFVDVVRAIAFDSAGNMYFSDLATNLVRRLTPDGLVGTIAGQPSADPLGQAGFVGDGGPAADSMLSFVTGLALDAEGNLYISERGNRRVRRINNVAACEVESRPQIASAGLVSGATFSGSFAAPGQIFSIFGVRLGPDQLVGVSLDSRGRLSTELAGTRVLIDGIPAPMIFSWANQVGGIVPYGVEIVRRRDESGQVVSTGDPATVQLEYQGVRSEISGISIQEANPGLFTSESKGTGQAAALNEDGTFNGPFTPTAPGSIVILFATGEGRTTPPGADGKLAVDVLPKPLLPVEVLIQGEPAEILFAGGAPGFAGVLQITTVRLKVE